MSQFAFDVISFDVIAFVSFIAVLLRTIDNIYSSLRGPIALAGYTCVPPRSGSVQRLVEPPLRRAKKIARRIARPDKSA
jgi:hypothetical protein